MPREPSQREEIIFENLGGDLDDESEIIEVDLDAKDGDDGITRKARTSSDDGEPTGDDVDGGIDYSFGRDDDDGDADDGGKSGDDKALSKFEKRLKRERRVTRRERERADKAEAENVRLRKQAQKARTSNRDEQTRDLDRQIDTITADLEQAIEAGNTKEHVRLNGLLTDAKAERIAAKYVQPDDDDDGLDDGDAGTATRTPETNELTEEWMERHHRWYNKKGFARFNTVARELDQEVFKDGFDPEDEDYYEELDRRLQEELPNLFDENGDPAPRITRQSRRQQQSKERKRSPVAAADDASRERAPLGNPDKVELGPEEFENMRTFGLDPRNAEHVKEYALNKRQSDAEERTNAR